MDLDEGFILFYEMEGVAKRFMKNVLTIFQNIIVQERLETLPGIETKASSPMQKIALSNLPYCTNFI